ncbi:hypothetical protein D3C86_1464980 [compost metagenome]
MARHGGGLVHGRGGAGHPQRGHAAGIDNALHAGLPGGFHHGHGAIHVGPHDFLGIGRPEPVVGRHVEQVAHARHRTRHGRRVTHIALDHLHGQPGEVGTRAGGPHQHPDLETPVEGLPHHRRAKKARRACHQNAIVNFSSPVYRLPFWAVKALNHAHCEPKARVGPSQRARQKFLHRYIVTTVSRKVMPAYQDKKMLNIRQWVGGPSLCR